MWRFMSNLWVSLCRIPKNMGMFLTIDFVRQIAYIPRRPVQRILILFYLPASPNVFLEYSVTFANRSGMRHDFWPTKGPMGLLFGGFLPILGQWVGFLEV